MDETPRLRMFAGLNGSGKSTIQNAIPSHLKGVYINPDDIERDAKDGGLNDQVQHLTYQLGYCHNSL
ncbi:MAG: hypothetical protein ACQEW0_05695 [Pseudomonadota bacterium]